jgi:hypothetical protein
MIGKTVEQLSRKRETLMNDTLRWMAGLLVVGLLIGGMVLVSADRRSASPDSGTAAATVEHLEGSNPTRVTLTEDAANRLGIETAPSRDLTIDQATRGAIPYAAILYDTQGATWAYTNPVPLTFVRNPVTVDRIQGDLAILSHAFPSDTAVVTVGAEELYGAETEFQEE